MYFKSPDDSYDNYLYSLLFILLCCDLFEGLHINHLCTFSPSVVDGIIGTNSLLLSLQFCHVTVVFSMKL